MLLQVLDQICCHVQNKIGSIMKRLLSILHVVLALALSSSVMAQTYKVTGKVTERNNSPIPGAVVSLISAKDSTQRLSVLTDGSGNFAIGANPASYKLRVSILGFQDVNQDITITSRLQNVGSIALRKKMEVLDEITIEGQKTPVVQKGDTTEMSAAAYKVNVDANAQDLVQKMPGVTIENGTIKAHGEDVKRVLVDGKNYFGEDASMALQNLPAEVIDKVQIYNKLSDQAEFTGFDDGNSSKVMNIVTRSDRRKGENGTVTLGHDNTDKYVANGRLNIFRGDRKITLTGGSNNINQQNFSTQDFLGAMGGGGGGGGRRGGGGGSNFIGRQSGINTSHGVGLNYTDYIGKGNCKW